MSKQFYTWFTCCLFAILTALPLSVNAEELTVNDGTATSTYVPVYGYYGDYGSRSQFVIPASDLQDMEGGSITALTFYANMNFTFTGKWDVYMMTTSSTITSTSFLDKSAATKVVSNYSVVIDKNQLNLSLDAPFVYSGDNLMIEFVQTTGGNYSSSGALTWTGVASSKSIYSTGSSSSSAATGTNTTFVPKVMFTYDAAQTSCGKPGTISLDTVTAHTAGFSWTASPDNENSWILLVKEGNNVLVDNETVSTPSYTVTGLSSSSVHTLSVEVIHACEDDSTSRATTLKFATLCEAIADLPWTEDFESMDMGSSTSEAPLCWSLLNANDGAYPYIYVNNSSSYVHGGTQSLYFQSSDSRAGYAILPSFADSALIDAEIIFYYKHENDTKSGIPAVGYITNIADASTFVAIQELERNTSWTKAQVELGTIPSGARLAIRYAKQSSNYYMGIDDIEVRKLPTCRPPRRLWIDTITTNSAKLAWHPTAASGNYQVKVKNGEAVLADSRVDGDTTFVISGLEHSSMYRNLAVDIFSICSASDSSEVFSTTFSFNTACQTMEFTKDSLILGFNDYDSGELLADLPCWDTIRDAGVTADWKISTTTYNNTAKSAYISGTGRGAGKYAVLISPAIEISAGYELQAYAKESSEYASDSLIFYVNDAPALDGATRIGDMKALSTSWQQFRQELGQSGELYILIQAYGAGAIYVDELLLKPAPVCPLTTGLVRDSLSYDYVRFSWNAAEGQNAWKVNISDTRGEIAVYDEVVNDPFYEIDYLEPLTTDTVTVKVIGMCEAGNSEEVLEKTFIFTTLASCPIPDSLSVSDITGNSAKIAWKIGISDNYNVRYREAGSDGVVLSEGFEGGSMPDGWTQTGDGTWSVTSGDYSTTTGAAEGLYNAKITISAYSGSATLITPVLDLAAVSNAKLSYWHIQRSWSGDNDELRVYYRASSSDSWTLIPGQAYTSAISSWTLVENVELPNPSATYQLAFEMSTHYGYGVAIDDIKITGTPSEAAEWISVGSVEQKSAHLTGLTPETTYEAQAQGICGDELSDWSSSVIFTTLPACILPANPTVRAIGVDSAVVAWSATHELYSVLLKQDTTIMFQNEEYAGDSIILRGLTAATEYSINLSLVGICSDELKSDTVVAPLSFITNCVPVTELPWSENFDALADGVFAKTCWINEHISGSGTSLFKVNSSTTAGNTTKQLQLPDMAGGTITRLTLPLITIPQANKYAFKLTIYRNSSTYNDATDQEGVRVFANYGGEDIELAFLSRQYSAAHGDIPAEEEVGWYEYELMLPQAGDCNIILQGESQYCTSTYLDNFEVFKLPDCAKPTAFAVDSVTAHSAVLSWSAQSGISAWRLDYKKASAEVWTALEAPVTDTVVVLDSLDASTLYNVRLAAMCAPDTDPESLSAYVELSVATECETIASFPWSENFDGITGSTSSHVLPLCWSSINTTTYSSGSYYPTVYNSSTYALSGDNSLRLYSYISTDPKDQYAILPAMENISGLRIKLNARAYSSSYPANFKVGVMSDPTIDSTFVQIAALAPASAAYEQFVVSFANYEGDGQYIAIKIDAASGSSSTYVHIDDILVEEIPDCLEPSDLAAVLTPGNGTIATLNWAAGADEAAWIVEYSSNADFSEAIQVNAADTAMIGLTGLTAEATYYARVKAVCGEGNESPWSDAISFVPTNAVYLILNNGTTTNNYVPFEGYNLDVGGTKSQFIIPDSNLVAVQWGEITKLTFYASDDNINWGTAKFDVYMASTTASSLSSLSDWSAMEKVATAASVSVSDGKMTIILDEPYLYVDGSLLIGFNQASTGSYVSVSWYGVSSTAGSSYYYYYDYYSEGYEYGASNFLPKMKIEYVPGEAPACLKPTGLAVSDITSLGATISWNAIENGAWFYAVAPASAAEPADADFVATTDTFVVINDKVDNTEYIFYLRADCGEDGASESSRIAFHTLQLPVAVGTGFSDDFENGNNWLFVNGAKHGWVIGEAAHNGVGTRAMYVSTDNGVTNDYYKSTANIVYAKKLFTFAEGSYEFNYDWRAYGEGSWDYLRVALVADSVELTAGVSPTGMGTSALPTGWIALDGGSKLNLQSSWQHYTSAEVTVAAGTYNVVFAWKNDGSSGTDPSAAVDNFEISKILCAKPTALAATEVSSSKATISWSSAEDGAWQIALDTLSGFNPDSVPAYIAADTNLYHLVELAAGKSYYAYVRMNCGENGFSSWSSKLSFSTPAGNLAPTGLAVDASSLTDQAATVMWKGIATNDKHESFELYYSKLAALPDTLNTDSLITAIADTMYSFSGLETETTYYVWVRDNCGSDGMSAWTAAVSFTTLNSCPVPANLSVANITAHTADIAWEIGNNESYNVRYRKSAGIDADLSEEFGTAKPTGWSMYTGLYNETAGTATLTAVSYGWSFGTGSNGVFNNHAYVNIYGNYQRWLATPAIDVNNAVLEFDLALTAYSGALVAPATTGTDDKFIVLVSEDNKASWQVLRKWDNAGSQYVYNNIPNTADGEHVSISLNAYNGKSIIIAFYGESTVSNADNNLHIDNVVVGSVIAEEEWAIANGTAAKQLQLTGLDPETTYEAQVQGICGNDATEWSEEIIRFKTIEACFAPSAPAVSEITAHGATLSWHSDADAWQICLNGDEDNLIAASDTLFVLTGLPADSAYTVKVRTNCGSEGFSKWSNSVSFTTLVACAVPTHVVANDVRAHSAEISWSSDATAWQICLDGNEDNLIDVTDTVYVVTGLAADTVHTVKVRANCGDEGFSKWSSVVRFTTLVSCPAPQGLHAELTPGDGSVARLVWESADANAWVVEYSLNANMSDSISVEVEAATLSLTGLTADTTYYARVKADCGDEDGVSLWSSVISFVPTDRYEMIINDGTVRNTYIPFYLYYIEQPNSESQFIVPAEKLTSIAGDTITALTFYASQTVNFDSATFEVYMAEVNYTTVDTTEWSAMNKVMEEAHLSLVNNQMVVSLSTPYEYQGGNLMIGFKQPKKHTTYYNYVSWYGENAEGASYSIYGGSTRYAGQRNFLPKMKINFIPVEKETAVEEILSGAGSDGKAVKFIRDNRVYILRDGVVYDILGAVVR